MLFGGVYSLKIIKIINVWKKSNTEITQMLDSSSSKYILAFTTTFLISCGVIGPPLPPPLEIKGGGGCPGWVVCFVSFEKYGNLLLAVSSIFKRMSLAAKYD